MISGIIAVFQNDVPVKLEVEDQLLYKVISLEGSVLVGVFGEVVGGLRVVSVKRFDYLFLLLLGGELLLVNPHLVVLIHVEEVSVVLYVLRGLFLNCYGLLALHLYFLNQSDNQNSPFLRFSKVVEAYFINY